MRIPLPPAALVLFGLLASEVGAQGVPPVGSGGWDSLRVPGGVAALLQIAELDPARPRTTALRDIIRVLYPSPVGTDAKIDARRAQVLDYLAALSAFEQAASAFGSDSASLSLAQDGDARRRIEGLASVLGHTLEEQGSTFRLVLGPGSSNLSRRQHLVAAGLDVEDVAVRFNRGEPLSLSLPSDIVPLPMPAGIWSSLLRPRREYAGTLLASILSDRSAALLYYGMTALDEETRQYLQERPAVIERLLDSRRAAVFAGLGRSIRIAGGRMALPGGSEAEPLWEALAGAPAADPERFVIGLLDRDGGRLALLHDTARLLDGPRCQFLLGAMDPDPESRLRRFRRLYQAMRPALAGWDPRLRPFYRNRYDLAHILALTQVRDDGAPKGPRPSEFWRRVFETDELSRGGADGIKNAVDGDDVDAAGMVEMLARLDYSAPRAEAWWFAHRRFDDAPSSQWPDILVTLRGFARYRVLVVTLERFGVTDARTYAAAVTAADRLTRLGARAATALALFQSAVGLIERASLGRVIDRATAARLVDSLCAVPLTADGEFRGGIGLWIDRAYLPAVAPGIAMAPDPSDTRPAEHTILAAFAGRAIGPADVAHAGLNIEGLAYTVDVAGAEFVRLREVHHKLRGLPVDHVLELTRAAAALTEDGITHDLVAASRARLEEAAQALIGPPESVGSPAFDREAFAGLTARASGDLRQLTQPADRPVLETIAGNLLRAGDGLLARSLTSLLYAPHLADDGLLLLSGSPADRHDLALASAPLEAPVPNPWMLARENRARDGWYLTGSLLGIDLALGEQSLRRVVADRVPQAPTIKESDRHAVADAVVLANAFDYKDEDRDALVRAISTARARLAAVAASPGAWTALAAEAGITDYRQHLLVWALEHEADRAGEFLSLGELARLGRGSAGPVAGWDAWGTSGRWLDGRWSLVYPAEQPFELLAGRRGSALVVALVPDLALGMAEALAARGLPAVLTRHVLAVAAQDFIDEIRLAYEDDWPAMIAIVPELAERVEDYIAALTVRGPLRRDTRKE